jgi:hypothetical protein
MINARGTIRMNMSRTVRTSRSEQRSFGRLALYALLFVGCAFVFGPAISARAALPASCSASAGFDAQSATDAELHACGVTKVPLSGTQSLPGGGTAYQYELPDGQVVSFPQTPANFNAVTASSAEDAAYGVPPAPAIVDTSYNSWA